MQKWEYCSLGPILIHDGLPAISKKEKTIIAYFHVDRADVQKITKKEVGQISNTIAQLGADGWEMVGWGNLNDTSGYIMYFKRLYEGVEVKEQRISSNPQNLSELEQQIISLIVQGKTNATIASELNLTEGQVDHHIRGLYSKLGVNSRIDLAVKAVRDGLIEET